MRAILLSAVILMMAFSSYTQVVFTEDFENGGNMPAGWTQQYINKTVDWTFQAGGQSGHPASAHSGSYNALFTISTHANDGAKTRLISPDLNLDTTSYYTLTFYLANEKWNTDQDTLKVYYYDGTNWKYMRRYYASEASWTAKRLHLPPNAKKIAFEGEAEYGYGICIDDVSIEKFTERPTVNTCNDVFVDDGGLSGNYPDNQAYKITYTSDNNSCIRAVISSYNFEFDFDYLYIYDGTDASGDLLQVLTGPSIDPNVNNTTDDNGTAYYGLSGSLTFYFYSDGAVNKEGWEIEIDCPENCIAPPCSENVAAGDDCESPAPICNLNGYCGNTGSSYTADHTELDYDQGGPFCGTIENNSWLTFVPDNDTAYIDVWVYNCTGISSTGNIHGIQIEIFEGTCDGGFTAVSNCWSPNKEANGRIKATGLTPGQTYYIMIDGWGADDCEYTFAASSKSGIVVASAGLDQAICEGQSVDLHADGGVNITWASSPADPGLTGQENNADIHVSPSQTTVYTATVSGTNPICPNSTADVVVYVNQANAQFTGLDQEYCDENTAHALTGNYPQGVFSGDGITGSNFNPHDAGIGSHDITYQFQYSVVTAFTDDFDPAPVSGWTTGATGNNSWVYGQPSGGNGDQASSTSYPDPLIDHTSTNTDNNVLGQGLYEYDGSGLGGYYNSSNEWVMTPAIDCSNLHNTVLSFWRWANFEPSYDEAYVEISNDGGSSWHTLGEPTYPQDDQWVFRSINIASYADGNTIYIRWRSESDGATTYSGWNIDDVQITGVQYDNSGQCVSTDVQSTTVYQPVQVSVNETNASICEGNTYTASGTVTGGITTGYWTTSGSGSFDNSSNLTAVYTPSPTDIYNGSVVLTLHSNDPAGPCNPETAQINLTITPADDAEFQYPTSTICNTGGTVQLSDSPSSPGSFSSTPSGLAINSSTGEIDANSSTVGHYTVTYNTTGSCPTSYSVDIDITDGFDAEFYYSQENYCQSEGNIVALHNTGSNGTYSSTSGLNFVNANTGEINLSASNPGTYVITNTIPASGSCPAASFTDTITVYEAADLTINADNNLCSNEILNITANLSGSANGISWTSSGDGVFSNANNETTSYMPGNNDISNGAVTLTATTQSNNSVCPDVSKNVLINIHQQPNIVIDEVQPHCNLSDGKLTATGTNGSSPYTYQWSNGATSQFIENIPSGTYSVTVTDNNSCQRDTTISLSDQNAGSIHLLDLTNPTCYGYTNGQIAITMNGGAPDFTYQWSNGADTAILSGIGAGVYSVTVIDAYDCKVSAEYTVIEPSEITYISDIYNLKCFGDNNGRISLNVTGGTSPYNYYWDNYNNDSPVLDNLSAGSYYLTISDANSCTKKDTFEITQPEQLQLDAVINDASCKQRKNGSVAVSVSGGVKPYNFTWQAINSNDSVLMNIAAGNYRLVVADSNSCTVSAEYNVGYTDESCIFIPSVFTPNNDGINDTWEIRGVDLYEHVTINVFNRWGDVVFSFDGKGSEYLNKENQWNGSFKTKGTVPLTTFVYVVDFHEDDELYKGTVTIVR